VQSSFHRNMDLRSWDTSLLTRYASVTAPASKGQMPRRRLRSQTFGLSIIFSLALPLRPVTASAEEKARCRARATRPPVSILTPYGPKALERDGRLAAYCVVRPSLSSAKNSPTARSRLRRSVLADRKGRASHRHRSGLKIPPRPLAAPASPAVGGSRPLLHWPASSSEERAGLPALARYAAFGQIHDHLFTRIFDPGWTPNSRLRASRVVCSLVQSLCRVPVLRRARFIPASLSHSHLSMRLPNTNRNAAFNPSGSRRIRADLESDGFNTALAQRAGDRCLITEVLRSIRAGQRDGSYVPSRRPTRIPLTLQAPVGDRSRQTAPPR
jgi:hypothetical protein